MPSGPGVATLGVACAALGFRAVSCQARTRRSQRLQRRARGGDESKEQDKASSESSVERLKELEDSIALGGVVEDAELALEREATPGTPRFQDVRRDLPRALPFLPEPGFRAFALNVPGDAGFDPLGLCTDVSKFINYREAETKHGRLAMVAALAWPLAEFAEPQLSEELGLPDALAESGGRFLPTFTGGLGDQFVEGFITLALIIGAIVELQSRPDETAPGDNGFDPLGLAKWQPGWSGALLPPGRPWMGEAEVTHGRLAMLAVLYDIVDEASTGNSVAEDADFFFHRIDSRLLNWDYWTFQPDVI